MIEFFEKLVEVAERLIQLGERSAGGVDRAQHVAVGERKVVEHLRIRRQNRQRVGRDRHRREGREHLGVNVGALLEQAAFFAFFERSDAADGGARASCSALLIERDIDVRFFTIASTREPRRMLMRLRSGISY